MQTPQFFLNCFTFQLISSIQKIQITHSFNFLFITLCLFLFTTVYHRKTETGLLSCGIVKEAWVRILALHVPVVPALASQWFSFSIIKWEWFQLPCKTQGLETQSIKFLQQYQGHIIITITISLMQWNRNPKYKISKTINIHVINTQKAAFKKMHKSIL